MTKIGVEAILIRKMIDGGILDPFGYNRHTLHFNLDNLLLTSKYILIKSKQGLTLD